MAETEAPASRRKPPVTATPSAWSYRASPRLYVCGESRRFFQVYETLGHLATPRQWLGRKHKVRGPGYARLPDTYLHEKLGLERLTSRTRHHAGVARLRSLEPNTVAKRLRLRGPP